MNEFTAKKLAEVSAFGAVAGAVLDRAGSGFAEAAPGVARELAALDLSVVAAAIPADRRETYDAKVAKTTAKLTQMMELYVGDEWDNPVEVLEWSSFLTGAAAAHCALASSATAGHDGELSRRVAGAEDQFALALEQIRAALRIIGKAKA